MGIFINFIGGMDEDMLPIEQQIGGVIANTPYVLKSNENYLKTKRLFERSNVNYRMVDSGGFQMRLINDENEKIIDPSQRTVIIMNPDLPIYLKKKFNLCAEHVVKADELFKPDFIVSPDLPLPDQNDRDQQKFLYLNSIGYNIYSAFQISYLLEQSGSTAKLLVPIQAYDLAEFQLYLNHLKYIKYAGLSFPCRLMTLERMAVFFIKSFLAGVKIIHVLGTGRFSYIAFIAYFARNFFDFTSIDSTNLSKFSTVNSYLEPFSLIPFSLRMSSTDDLSKPIICSCPWCSHHTSYYSIQNKPKQEKRSFIVNHNHYVIEQLMTESYNHASTALELYNFLRQKTSRKDDCLDIFRVLTLVESAKNHFTDDRMVTAFFNKLLP